ncbi:M24 family metallopeptidase [Pseudosulfitobacter pseudonitzschiae]|uniref:M24 family metallopeptidase n=1 Tax=Pseudosulfitobacter pseudonitzschiae TaxID=1402135 RepID=UPI001AFC31A3|nr:M24 family metallopeptidase [Pseudosulfitobacter pseudonitzschiae]MBM1815704.1 M24 family metallopeptidase [Pseudosulfitobacter pseudonitzschiae]MBM1832695.1 M24 family metallopeptidase [Pseudosulfitobacter pseudonitzschiae]MBM1837563.1 M24 family metallopeptidase [Pseudosulfitobacter pseudonitzschiae]MBM1842409.1 M24 family metallopeptidase [Pseudosulfitobacter pseudonitzschiae]MBM1847277.1 M24 family metallopeptidase [Pseudosulfitobacter pseudonitzschiae]
MIIKNLPFTSEEYDRRIALVRGAMDAAGIDTLFVTDPSNQAWLTGYDGWSFYVHQGVILRGDGDPIWWGRRQDSAGARRTVWMDDDHVRGYDDHFVQSTERHPMQELSGILQELGAKRIGVEMDNYYFSAKAFAVMETCLPEAEFVDATAMVNWKRGVKSEPELEYMRNAARISEKIIDGLLERVEPGVPKNEVVAEIYRDAVRGVDGAWGDYPAIVPLLPSGSDAAAPHLTWDGRPFETGEATFFEISGCYRRYHAPFCRSLFLGTPPDFLKRAEAALVEGLEAGLDAARAGNRACDIANALAAPLEAAGIERGERCGYPIGLSYPPDWGERTISLRVNDETVLEPNMTFHFMPGLWMADWGLEITESIRITENGAAECFCNRPRKMFVKP